MARKVGPRKSSRLAPLSRRGEFKNVLSVIDKEAEARHGPVLQDQIARQVDVAPSAVSSWFSGRQTPRTKYIERLAKLYARSDDRLEREYRGRLLAAAGRNEKAEASVSQERAAREGMLYVAQSPRSKVEAGLVEYSVIGDFFERILDAFAKFDGFDLKIVKEKYLNLSAGLEEGRIGLGAPILATANRALHLSFLETPITMGVNAVTFRGILHGRRVLSFDPKEKSIQPIVTEDEVGGRFAINALGFEYSWDRDNCPSYDVLHYVNFLHKHWETWQAQSAQEKARYRVPVVFADELTCLEVQLEWLKLIRASDFAGHPAEPVLLIGEHRSPDLPDIRGADSFDPTHAIKYHVCMCVKRGEPHWPSYLSDAWRIFLHGSSDFLAHEYSRLHAELVRKLEPFSQLASKTKLYDLWMMKIEDWLRVNAVGSPPADALLFSDEAIWSKILWDAFHRTGEREARTPTVKAR